MSELRLIVCTAPTDRAAELARTLLVARVIGCANLIPAVRSLYWWQGEIEDASEVVMLMETPLERLNEALELLEASHPYTVPKILVLDPDSINLPYLDWLRRETVANPVSDGSKRTA